MPPSYLPPHAGEGDIGSRGLRTQARDDDVMRLQDKVALITGAGSGIGREAALLFAHEGAAIAVVDVSDQRVVENRCLTERQCV